MGPLMKHQNLVLRLPMVVTLFINIWLLIFESFLFVNVKDAYATARQHNSSCADQNVTDLDADPLSEGFCNVSATSAAPSLGLVGLAVLSQGVMGIAAVAHLMCYLFRLWYYWGVSSTIKDSSSLLVSQALLVFFSFLGCFASPFFFASHVLEFFNAEAARSLLSAVTKNLSKLAQAFLIILAVVYVWAAVGFRLFQEKHAEGKCTTFLNCVISYLDGGLAGSGIHDILEFDKPTSLWDRGQVLQWFLQIFAMFFLIIYVQVLLAIFSGIIIDSFGEIRDKSNEVHSHLVEGSHILSFSKHWGYVNLFVFLHVHKDVPYDELTDLEAYVRSRIAQGDSDWLPYNLLLASDDRQEDDRQGRQQEALAQSVEVIGDRLGAFEQKVEARLQEQTAMLSQMASALLSIQQAVGSLEHHPGAVASAHSRPVPRGGEI